MVLSVGRGDMEGNKAGAVGIFGAEGSRINLPGLTFTVGISSMPNFLQVVRAFLELQSTAASFIIGHQSVSEILQWIHE